MTKDTIRLGAGAGFAGDRIDPAVQLARFADLDYLIFECLGERTVAAGQKRKNRDPLEGYDPLLEKRMRAVLPYTLAQGTTIITNSGAANPAAAAQLVARVAREVVPGRKVTIAVIEGDDVLDSLGKYDPLIWGLGKNLSEYEQRPISAHAYIGAECVVPALRANADVVIAGRLADPSLYLAPMIHEFGWEDEAYHLLGSGTCVGHLLECAGQLTGGYYADPVTKPVPGLATLGFPFADVSADGSAIFGKLEDTGGILNAKTCGEQLLYEVADPAAYVTPDVVADFSHVEFQQLGPQTVKVSGATGTQRPQSLKVTLGFAGGWLGEGQISYAGPRALERAQLAADIVEERLTAIHGVPRSHITREMIGGGAAFRGLTDFPSDPVEIRLRVAARVEDRDTAEAVGWEVESLYTNGPAGGGGVRQSTTDVVEILSTLIPRESIVPRVSFVEVNGQ